MKKKQRCLILKAHEDEGIRLIRQKEKLFKDNKFVSPQNSPFECIRSNGFWKQVEKMGQKLLTIRNGLNLISGSPTNEFNFQNGVRQGYPLSPFLFIIAEEALNVALIEARSKGNTYLTTNDSDGWRWSMESSGVYSVKSLRADLDDKILPISSKIKWSSLIPKKVCVFIWRAEKDRLHARLNLDKRNIDLD
ncbi:hypothetical protein Tco_0650390 [Tanacetum coccineum]